MVNRHFFGIHIFKNLIWILYAGFCALSLPSSANSVGFQGSLKLRWDTGEEANPTLSETYPDNLTSRNYLEALLTAEVRFKKLPIGDRLRLGLRVLEQQASDVDGIVYGLEDKHRIDDKIYAQWNWKKWEIWGGDVYETI